MAPNFTKEISLKMNRTKKKLTTKNYLSFTKEINSKIIQNKKKIIPIWSQKYFLGRQVGENFWKKSPQEPDFKNVGSTPQRVPNLTPIRKLFCTFLY